MSKSNRNREQARARIAGQRAAQARRRRRGRWLAAGAAAVVAAGAAAGITLAVTTATSTGSAGGPPSSQLTALSSLGRLQSAPAPGAKGAEGVPVPAGAAPLATAATKATGGTVDGISCQTNEQTIFHIHAHLTVFVNGSARQIPAAIGIPGGQAQQTPQGPFIATGTCFYWLHTHAADGIIHIESPVHRTYTLGNFFDEWGQTLGPNQVGSAHGHVTAIYNGKVFHGNPRDLPLTAHAQIQLEVGTPLVAPVSITWPSGL